MRHVALDLTLTDVEAREMVNALLQYGVPASSQSMIKLAASLARAMQIQPENILFFEHDSDEVLRTRQLCDFCNGTGKEPFEELDDCLECDGTGKDMM